MDIENFSFIYYRHNRLAPYFEIPKKVIKFHDLTFILKGSVTYNINGNEITVHAGDAIFISSGSVRQRNGSEEKADFISFNFKCDNDMSYWQTVLHDVIDRNLLDIFSVFDAVSKDATQNTNHLCTDLLSFIVHMVDDLQNNDKNTSITIAIKRYLKDNLKNKVTLENVGKALHFSPIYCDSIFKKETGRSIIDFLIELRIDEAKKLLNEQIFSVYDVAETVGFEDYNYFSRTFKKRTGYTPKKYINSFEK
jgi:YesN/AraC family two-component response regulator